MIVNVTIKVATLEEMEEIIKKLEDVEIKRPLAIGNVNMEITNVKE